MNTFTHTGLLLFFSFITTIGISQTVLHDHHNHDVHEHSTDCSHSNHQGLVSSITMMPINSNPLALIDLLKSDEGADFNCSGGFCMNKSHYHKKGLTLKKQYFVYFMNISC